MHGLLCLDGWEDRDLLFAEFIRLNGIAVAAWVHAVQLLSMLGV